MLPASSETLKPSWLCRQRFSPKSWRTESRRTPFGSGCQGAPPGRRPIQLPSVSSNSCGKRRATPPSNIQGHTPIQIFATDVARWSIEKARLGLYPESIAAEVSSERLKTFFVKTDRGYQVSKPVRDMCVFARQNVTKDAPFSGVDL